jgi:4-alpha-glucanotransferase
MKTMQEFKIKNNRSAGILMPVFSLPSPYGIGTFGQAAYQWIDFLKLAGQSYWQVLPLGPTSYGDSPYQSVSAFAGNPYFIDPGILCEEGLLQTGECGAVQWGINARRVEYKTIFDNRDTLLRKAYSRFTDQHALESYQSENAGWLNDYALFMAIKAKLGPVVWNRWEAEIRRRSDKAVAYWQKELREETGYHVFLQYQFHKQWAALKDYANRNGVGIIGDLPIYVSMDSADVWANSELFLLNENNRPVDVAGCPPDAFCKTGQLWGNPIYRWDVLRQTGFDWWIKRLRFSFALYDIVRIDHFRGFESYYAVPGRNKTAQRGQWRSGPGMELISVIRQEFGKDRVIAEDLGFLTGKVRKLLQLSGYPGMKILQFAFDSGAENDFLPHNFRQHCVVYTGTHDNDTIRGWISAADAAEIEAAMEYLGIDDTENGNWAFIRAALASIGNLAIIPMQDYLDLGSVARINIPSTIGGDNWCWRMEKDAATIELAHKIYDLTSIYGRTSAQREEQPLPGGNTAVHSNE